MATPTASVLPPGPKSVFPVKSVFAFRRNPIKFLTHLTERYGDLVYFEFGPQPVFLLNHPDYIRDVLVTHHKQFMKSEGLQRAKRLLGEGLLTSEGEFHLRQRRPSHATGLSPPAHRRLCRDNGRICRPQQPALAGMARRLDIAREMMRSDAGDCGRDAVWQRC